jgi:hypothetical protein
VEAAQQREQDARRALNLLISIMDELPVGLTVQSDDGGELSRFPAVARDR